MLLTSELRKRHQEHSREFKVTAKRLADFLSSVEVEEAVLSQRLRDLESKNIYNSTEKGALKFARPVEQITDNQNITSLPSSEKKVYKINIDELEEYEEF
jgi:hypothetical protein